MDRRNGFIMVYAIGTLVLISALGNTMLDTGSGELAVSKARMYQQLARVNADSGIEYGMGVISREMARARRAQQGGPWKDPAYLPPANDCALNWMRHQQAFADFTGANACPGQSTTAEEHSEFSSVRLHDLRPEGEGDAGTGIRWSSQFQLALAPELTFDRVRLETEMGNPHVFVLRSRGEITFDPDGPAGAQPVEILASAYAFQTFTVEFPDSCPTPRPTRQVWQLDMDPNGQFNWPRAPWPAGAPAQPPVGAGGPVSGAAIMRRPNIH